MAVVEVATTVLVEVPAAAALMYSITVRLLTNSKHKSECLDQWSAETNPSKTAFSRSTKTVYIYYKIYCKMTHIQRI